jgi:hypothetical protein
MPITKGSGQGSGGKGLPISGISVATANTLHTAVAGTATTQLITIGAVNNDAVGHTLTIVLTPTDLSAVTTIVETIPAQSSIDDVVANLPVNDTMVVKVYADTTGVLTAFASVSDQVLGANKGQTIPSGLITAVQATNAFRTNGLVSSATEAAHQIMIPAAGTLTNLRAVPSAAVGGGATCTVVVRVNGVGTALTLQFDNAAGTTLQTDSDSVVVAAGDLVTFLVVTDNAGAPATTFQCTMDYVAA